ncbi:MAG: hypothetical protein Q8P22_08830 [Chloroflexota bacterium]|nr:hypothetical protein [Chloroflexota bacterium]
MTQENKPRQGLKVVLEELAGRAMVGVQAKDCDPVLTVLPGLTLEQALERVPGLVAAARERWAQNPKMPAYQRPPEPTKPATPATRSTAAAPPKPRQPEVVRPKLM